MKYLNLIYRLLYIQFIFIKNGVDDVVTQHPRLWLFRVFVWFNPCYWFAKKQPRGVAIRRSLEQLGPIFVKFGQALSTRPDLFPDDIVAELSQLQDKVAPFATEKALEVLKQHFQKPVESVFAEFDLQALASASIAQVHAARLHSGEKVVVKILRPEIKKIIQNDLFILFVLANLLDKYLPSGKRLRLLEVVAEFKHCILDELDFNREAANAAQLRRNFLNSPLLYVPEVYWDYIGETVMVIEKIDAIPVNDISQLDLYKIDRKMLAERGIEIFFTQVFRDCFFHADMHPGNIFVSREHPQNPQYLCVDFGIMGTLNQTDQYYLAQNLLAFFNRDYLKVANLHIASSWVPIHTRAEDFASAIRTVCEPIFEKPLKDISFGLLMVRLFQVARRFHMVVQPQLILLQKTLLAVEGLGRQIYPDLDLWQTAKPYLASWVKQQMGPKAFLKHCKENLPFLIRDLPYVPHLIFDVLTLSKQQLQQQQMQIAQQPVQTKKNTGLDWVLGIGFFSVLVWLGLHLPQHMNQTEIWFFLSGFGLSALSVLLLIRNR